MPTTEFNTDTAEIITDSSPTYTKEGSEDGVQRLQNNTKILGLRWIHKDAKTGVISPVLPNELPSDYHVYWYRYKLGAKSPDNFAGAHWERLYGWTNPFTQDEQGSTVLRLNDKEEYNISGILEDGQTDLTTDIIDNITFYPNINRASEQLKAIIVKQEKSYLGIIDSDVDGNSLRMVAQTPILEFTNETDVRSEATLIDANALAIKFEDESNGNYFLYNRAGKISKQEYSQEAKKLTAVFDPNENNIYNKNVLAQPYTYIKWTIPAKNSMIIPILNDMTSLTEDEESYEYTYIRQDDDTEDSNLVSIEYRLRDKLNYNFNRNTVTLEVQKDGELYVASASLHFGPSGTSGSDYTLYVEWLDGDNAFDINKGELKGRIHLYDQAGADVDLELANENKEKDPSYELSWYKVKSANIDNNNITVPTAKENKQLLYPVLSNSQKIVDVDYCVPMVPSGSELTQEQIQYYYYDLNEEKFKEASSQNSSSKILYRYLQENEEKKPILEFQEYKEIDNYNPTNKRAFVKNNGIFILDPWNQKQDNEIYYVPKVSYKKFYDDTNLNILKITNLNDIFTISSEQRTIPVNIGTDLYILEIKLINFGDYDLITRIPIPLKNSDPKYEKYGYDEEDKHLNPAFTVDYIEGPTDVRYSSAGETDFDKNPYQITCRLLEDGKYNFIRQGYPLQEVILDGSKEEINSEEENEEDNNNEQEENNEQGTNEENNENEETETEEDPITILDPNIVANVVGHWELVYDENNEDAFDYNFLPRLIESNETTIEEIINVVSEPLQLTINEYWDKESQLLVALKIAEAQLVARDQQMQKIQSDLKTLQSSQKETEQQQKLMKKYEDLLTVASKAKFERMRTTQQWEKYKQFVVTADNSNLSSLSDEIKTYIMKLKNVESSDFKKSEIAALKKQLERLQMQDISDLEEELMRLKVLKNTELYFIKPLLQPSNIYFEDTPIFGVKFVVDYNLPKNSENPIITPGTVLWSQPVYMYQDNYPSTTLNKWNGKEIVTDSETGVISANGFSAGKKEKDNTFTGVVLGDWSRTDTDAAITKQTGIYGFNHGAMSYAFKDDGTAFLGKDGKGRIYFNGNKAQIYSSGWITGLPISSGSGKYTQQQIGMMLDIDDGIFKLQNNTDSILMQPGKFIVSSMVSNRKKLLINIDSSSGTYYLQSKNYNYKYDTASGRIYGNGGHLNLQDGFFRSLGSNTYTNIASGSLIIKGQKYTSSGSVLANTQTTLLDLTNTGNFYLQSANYASGVSGTKINLTSGKLETLNADITGKITNKDSNGQYITLSSGQLSGGDLNSRNHGYLDFTSWSRDVNTGDITYGIKIYSDHLSLHISKLITNVYDSEKQAYLRGLTVSVPFVYNLRQNESGGYSWSKGTLQFWNGILYSIPKDLL